MQAQLSYITVLQRSKRTKNRFPAKRSATNGSRTDTPLERRSLIAALHEDVREPAGGELRTLLFERSIRLHRCIERLFDDAKGKRGMGRSTNS
ncbi:MAG: hypothetical protein ACRYGI_02465 [Janthinobacterium lividum]